MPVDIENLAAGYAHRPTSSAALDRARRAADGANLDANAVAVDVGGGPGAHAGIWAQRGARAIVIDPSRGMTRKARKLSGVVSIRAQSQLLPLRDDTAQLVYFHLSLHYGDWRAALDEAHRVLRRGGECWIWTMGEDHHRGSFLARWFPSVGDIDTARFPDPAVVNDYLGERWAVVTTGKEVEPKTMPAGQWRAAAEARFVSTLQLVPEAEFRSGMAEYDKTYPNQDDPVEYSLVFDWIRARK